MKKFLIISSIIIVIAIIIFVIRKKMKKTSDVKPTEVKTEQSLPRTVASAKSE